MARKLTEEEKDNVVRLYNKYKTMTAVAMRAGCHSSTVKKILKDRGVEINILNTSDLGRRLDGRVYNSPLDPYSGKLSNCCLEQEVYNEQECS